MTFRLILLILSIMPAMCFAVRASAEDRATVLAISGAGEAGQTKLLSMPELEGLGTVEIVTTTPWNERPIRFTGVPMRRLLEFGGPGKTRMVVRALNDYAATIPVSQVLRYQIILASRRDGERMPLRGKGPLWVIYPLDAHPELDLPENHARMVWQVAEIELR